MNYYAELNENNICYALLRAKNKIDKKTLINIDFYDESLLGKRYDNGEWLEVEQPEIEPQETQLDRIENAVNDIAKNNTSYAEMAQAIAEGVNDIE